MHDFNASNGSKNWSFLPDVRASFPERYTLSTGHEAVRPAQAAVASLEYNTGNGWIRSAPHLGQQTAKQIRRKRLALVLGGDCVLVFLVVRALCLPSAPRIDLRHSGSIERPGLSRCPHVLASTIGLQLAKRTLYLLRSRRSIPAQKAAVDAMLTRNKASKGVLKAASEGVLWLD